MTITRPHPRRRHSAAWAVFAAWLLAALSFFILAVTARAERISSSFQLGAVAVEAAPVFLGGGR